MRASFRDAAVAHSRRWKRAVGGQFDHLVPVRLQAERSLDALHAGYREPIGPRHTA